MAQPIKHPSARDVQREIVERSRAESLLDRREPLGYPAFPPRPEFGLTVSEYYRRRHSPGGPGRGRFWPLHECRGAPWQRPQ